MCTVYNMAQDHIFFFSAFRIIYSINLAMNMLELSVQYFVVVYVNVCRTDYILWRHMSMFVELIVLCHGVCGCL